MFKEKFECIKLYVNVGIIGYVDYGKIMLIVVIIIVLVKIYGGVVCVFDQIDNVLEEKVCGIIINIFYVEYDILICYYVYVDCLGYVDYVKNMIIGVVQMDGVILVVVVIDGLMLQICEYILLGCQVGVLYIIVFLNKCDMVDDEELLELVEMEVCEFLFQYDFLGDDILIVCGFVLKVLEGDVEWEVKILELVGFLDFYILELECVIDKLFLLLIEDVFFIFGCGIVVIGCVECGIIKVGEEVEIVGIKEIQKFICIGVEMFCKLLDEGCVGENVGVLLCGIKCEEIECGQVLVKLGIIKLYIKFEFEVYILFKDEGGCYILFFKGYCLQFYFCIIDVIGIIELLEGVEMVMLGDNIKMVVILIYLIVMDDGLCFVICEGGCIVGVGVVVKVLS